MVGAFNDSRDQGATGERHEIAALQAEQALEEMRGIPYPGSMLDIRGDRAGGGGASDQRRAPIPGPPPSLTETARLLHDRGRQPVGERLDARRPRRSRSGCQRGAAQIAT